MAERAKVTEDPERTAALNCSSTAWFTEITWEMQLLEDSGGARPGICSEHNQWCTVQQALSMDEPDHCLSSFLFQASIISREINSTVAAGGSTGMVAIQLVTSD